VRKPPDSPSASPPARRRAIDITLTVHGHDLIEQTVDRNLTREASLLDELARTISRHLPAYSTDSIRR